MDQAAEAVDPDTDVHQSPFPASSGVGEDIEDTTSRPESITEIEILKTLLQADFSHSSWTNFDSTTWQSRPGFYLVYKSNNTVNMPQINGRGGAPHPCEVDGARWTLAWSYSKATNPATGILERVLKWQILSDNYHQPVAGRGASMKKALGALRNYWHGM